MLYTARKEILSSLRIWNQNSSSYYGISVVTHSFDTTFWPQKSIFGALPTFLWQLKSNIPDTFLKDEYCANPNILCSNATAVAFLIKPTNATEVIVSLPTDYKKIWRDHVTGEKDEGVAIWEPICQEGYVFLGHVATYQERKPSAGDIYCLHEKFTIKGTNEDWKLVLTIWNNVKLLIM